MENRRKLRESGIALILVGIYNVFMFIATIVDSIIDGTVSEAFAKVDADILVAVKVGVILVCVIMALLAAADIFLGIKGMQVSKNPTASRAYIIVTFSFLILSFIAVILNAISVFSGESAVLDASLNTGMTVVSICIYSLFIGAAEAVRKDVLNEKK